MKNLHRLISTLLVINLVFGPSLAIGDWDPKNAKWEYNPGPDPTTPFGRALIDLYAEMPEYSVMSNELMEDQKFRYIYGLMMTRSYFDENGVKILFVGQDATHIAEAAKQPGTSGFGARVQSIGNYLGVDAGVSTTNAFLSTIKGQYGAFDHIFIELDAAGIPQIRQSAYVDNELWMMANGVDSEIRIMREKFWEWMIKNNPESLQLMVVFGGAARDAFGEFLVNRGAKVGTRMNSDRLKNIQVPETKLMYAGGNNEFPVPIDKNGNDIYEILLGKKPDYSKVEIQEAAVAALKKSGKRGMDMMVFTGGGVNGSGVMNPAQLGGYNLDDIEINGKKTNSLKGLVLSDGFVVKEDLAFVVSPHPSALSRLKPDEASATIKKAFAKLNNLKDTGWKIRPDLDDNGKPRVNLWDDGKDYSYGRADIRQGYFEFGSPDDRRVSRADASRLDTQTIVAGTRDRPKFDQRLLSAAKEGKPTKELNPKDLWSVRQRQKDTRYIFDRGPGEQIAKDILESIDREVLFAPKNNGQNFEKNGIDAFNTKTHPDTGLFGFHRGSFEKSKVIVLADPHGIDDWITSRALTGERGQYLNGLIEDLGYDDQYLVIKTAPVGMDGATAAEWEYVRKNTENYREVAIKHALANQTVEAIFTDGEIAQKEMKRILTKMKITNIPVINIQRDGMKADSGITEAGKEAVTKIKGLARAKISGQMSDIPRSHLTWWSRLWEGTGGDHVIDALGKARGGVRALVAPNWVVRQKVVASPKVKTSIEKIQQELDAAGIRRDSEEISKFLARKKIGDGNYFELLKGRGITCDEVFLKAS